jgi:hypothetical protein
MTIHLIHYAWYVEWCAAFERFCLVALIVGAIVVALGLPFAIAAALADDRRPSRVPASRRVPHSRRGGEA